MEILDHVVFSGVREAFVCPDVRLMLDLQDLVETYYKFERDPMFYARQLDVSPYILNKACRYCFSKTVYKLLQDRVHEEAEYLLKNTRYSIKEIAYLIGCSDVAYFCRCFKRRIGMTPKEFRRGERNA
jgi:AraC-like DNA-binding protein